MKEATAPNVVKFFTEQVFQNFGVPEVIHSENGKQFVSKEFWKMLDTYRITHMKTAFYSPQSNASEMVNQSVLNAIRSCLDKDHTNLDINLSSIEIALRTSVQAATGVSPFFAFSVTTCSLVAEIIHWLGS